MRALGPFTDSSEGDVLGRARGALPQGQPTRSAGWARGAFLIDGRLVEAGLATSPQEVRLAQFRLRPGERRRVMVSTLPCGGSSYPVWLVARSIAPLQPLTSRLTNGVVFKFPLSNVDDINVLRRDFDVAGTYNAKQAIAAFRRITEIVGMGHCAARAGARPV